ncbi:FecR protein [Anaerohalosphaera lusitana]|uniref:FecR protein n=1 Tax=Anaerohalosphaera lusitana TaxID=1936003 RepID=A0A1U9NM23_9BACT|nr:LamG-like jellyroll fold domain-containing protein [Anaerohalosphaera lusitana]AQT68963.1 FecR protein [Anaerohalosphaera lusitana]
MTEATKRRIEYLTTASLEGTISDSQRAELYSILEQDSDCVDYYVKYVGIASSLVKCEPYSQTIEAIRNDDSAVLDAEAWMALAETERTAEAVEVRADKDRDVLNEAQRHSGARPTKQKTRISRLLLAITVVSSIVLIMILSLPVIAPQGEPVAILAETMDSVWDGDRKPEVGDVLRQGEFTLRGGYARILMDSGAELVLRGSVDLLLEGDNAVALENGKVFSRVPKRAQGFAVITPEAAIVDYGTEFGVSFEPSEGTAAHVFKGQVGVSSKQSGAQSEQRLFANQAARVERSGRVRTTEFRPEIFAQDVPTMYELAVLRDQPQGYWQMNDDDTESANNTALVDCPAKYVGEVDFTSGPELGNGVVRSAVQLSGKGYMYVPNLDRLRQTSSTWSATMWVRPEISGADDVSGGSDDKRYFILSGEGRYGYLVANVEGDLSHFYYSTEFGEWGRQDVEGVFSKGEWHHIGLTVDRDGNKRIYVDGRLVSGEIVAEDQERLERNAGGQDLTCEELYIGSVFDEGKAFMRGERDEDFVGSVAEVAIYDHALSVEAIESQYSASRLSKK